MALKKNIVANYLGTGVVALAPILALPWYLGALGSKQFGLIGFVAMLQAILGVLDAGMSQGMVREVAIRLNEVDNGQRRAATLLFGFERFYWLFAVSAACVTLILADFIVNQWLHLEGVPESSGKVAIYGAALIFAFQFPGSVYRSLLLGGQAQVTFNSIMLAGALTRHLGGVIVVNFWPTLSSYLLWHASMALLETLVRGGFAWNLVKVPRKEIEWSFADLQQTWRLVAGISGATLLGAVTVQMDKIVLSRMTSIEQFGYYTVAASVATGVLQLIYPLVQAILPRAIQMRTDPVGLHRLSTRLFMAIFLLTGLGAVGFLFVGKWILDAWLRNSQAADAVYSLLSVLLVGTGLNAFYNVGYMNWIVHKKIHRIFQVNLLGLVLSATLIPPLVVLHGIYGAAFGWVVSNLIGLLFSLEWAFRRKNE